VIPIPLNDDWNVISRMTVSLAWQKNIAGEFGSLSGLGDTLASFFFSPKKPGPYSPQRRHSL